MSDGFSVWLADENATLALGALLAEALDDGGIIYLRGDLGAGKTTLCRGLLHALGHSGAVKSPTYTLVEPYLLGARHVYHFDLYRLAGAEELEFLGIRDYLNQGALLLFEWPERGAGHLPPPDLELRLTSESAGRRVQGGASSPNGAAIVTRLELARKRAHF